MAPAVDNRLARGCLAVVRASLGCFLWAVYLSPDPGFAGIWPLMATAPLSMAGQQPPDGGGPAWDSSLDWLNLVLFAAGTTLCGLAKRRTARPARPPVHGSGAAPGGLTGPFRYTRRGLS
ncbi:SCO4225 family membrane protein [Streptomyces sp. AS02]|uniref:SCO4225 family membrane protein n=1 Tax=Streptomyces sp. AS02 TaxID=2938946 RepID=UPI00202213D9|nr:hypothetical protein [Streptomyces sp. AS02]MCL8013056.1 hypothetical protein [Streptomyces sp. AS02]